MAGCPLGYGGGKANANPMTCKSCRAIAFEPTYAEPCHCVYCEGCIEGVTDCYGCGRDVEGSSPAPDFQKKIEVFVKAHAPKEARERGLFWLENAVKHEGKRNAFASDARYTQALEAFRESDDSEEEVAICFAKQADIRWKYLSDVDTGRDLFKEAVSILAKRSNVKPASLAVTCMKWAAMEHTVGDLEESRRLFEAALSARLRAQSCGQCSSADVTATQFALANVLADLDQRQLAEEKLELVIREIDADDNRTARSELFREQSEERLRALRSINKAEAAESAVKN